jgi:hypothetical protein
MWMFCREHRARTLGRARKETTQPPAPDLVCRGPAHALRARSTPSPTMSLPSCNYGAAAHASAHDCCSPSSWQHWSWMPTGLRSLCVRYEYLARHPPTRPAPWLAAQRPLPAARRHASCGLSSNPSSTSSTTLASHAADRPCNVSLDLGALHLGAAPASLSHTPSVRMMHETSVCTATLGQDGMLGGYFASHPPSTSTTLASHAADRPCNVSLDLGALHLGAAPASLSHTPSVRMMHETSVCAATLGQDGMLGGYFGARREAEEAAARVSARPVALPAHTYMWPPPGCRG